MFTGREYLSELGIYDYRNRFYHPGLGRFLQSDPIGFGGGDTNLFRYSGGNPVNQADPFGLKEQPKKKEDISPGSPGNPGGFYGQTPDGRIYNPGGGQNIGGQTVGGEFQTDRVYSDFNPFEPGPWGEHP